MIKLRVTGKRSFRQHPPLMFNDQPAQNRITLNILAARRRRSQATCAKHLCSISFQQHSRQLARCRCQV